MQHKQQRGLTFLGLLVVGILLAFAGVVVAQLVPTYIEFMAVQKAAQKAAAGTTVSEVRSIFDKASQIDDIRSGVRSALAQGPVEITVVGDVDVTAHVVAYLR